MGPSLPSRPLRIALVAYRGNMHCGGQGVYLWFLARALAEQGHRVDVLVGPPWPDPMPFAASVTRIPNDGFWGKWYARDWAAFAPPEGPLHLLSPLRFWELGASYLGFLPELSAFSLRAFAALAARARGGERWDVVHDVNCLGWGLLGLRALGLPVVSTIHHPLTIDRLSSFDRDRSLREAVGTVAFHPIGMQAFVARHIDRVLTSSEWSAKRIARDFRVAPERLRNVYNGLDTGLFRPDPAVRKHPRELVCVGRANDANKGVRTLVEALARGPRELELVLIDDDHPHNPVFGWARRAGVADRVRVTGRLPTQALVRAYQRAALCVVPSRSEGFGLPALEAMACGTPVVATAAGALPEVVRLGGGGLLVPRDDPDALAAAIAELMADPQRREALARDARARVEAHFAWPRIAAATAAVYEEVIALRRGRPAITTTSASTGQRRAQASSA